MKASRYPMVLLLMVMALVTSVLVQPVASPVKADDPDGHHEIWSPYFWDGGDAERITNFGADTRHPALPLMPPWAEPEPLPIMAVVSNCSDNLCTCIGEDNEIFLLYEGEGDPLLWQLTDNAADDRDPALAILPGLYGYGGFVVYASNCSDNVCSSTADYELFLLVFGLTDPDEPLELYGPVQLTDNDADDIEPSLSFFPDESFGPMLAVAFASTCSDNMCTTAGDDYEIYGSVLDFDTEIPALYPEWWQFTDNDADDRHPSLVLWETQSNGESELVATIAYSSDNTEDGYFDIYLMNALLDEPPDLEIAGNWNINDIIGEGGMEADWLEPSLGLTFALGEVPDWDFPNTMLFFTLRCLDISGCEGFFEFGESMIMGIGMYMDDEDPYQEPYWDDDFFGFYDIGFDDIESSLLLYYDEYGGDMGAAFASDYRYFSANCTASPNPTKVDHMVEFECMLDSVSENNTECAEEDWFFEYIFYFGDGEYDYSDEYSEHAYSEPGTYCPKVIVEWWCGDPYDGGIEIGTETFFFDPVVVNPHLSVSCNGTPNPTEVGVPVSLSGNITGGVPPYNCLWEFVPSGWSTTNCNPTYTFSPEYGNNDWYLSLTVTDNLSNEATCGIEFWVYEALEVACDAEPNPVQLGTPVSFNCTATNGIPPYTYDLDFGDGGAHSPTCNTTYTYSEVGTFTATFTVTDNLTSRTCSENITVYNPLEVICSASPNPTSVGHEVQFTSTPSGGYGDYTYAWDFGDGIGTSDNQSAAYTYSDNGTFVASITVLDSLENRASCNVTMTVNPALGITCNALPNPTKVGHEVQFTCTPSGGVPGYTYSWDFGDGMDTSDNQSPKYTYLHDESEPQTYTAVVTVTDNLTNTASCNVTMTVNPGLGVRCDASPSAATLGQQIEFSCTTMGGVSPYSYEWNFGDGSSSTRQNPTYAYSSTGRYTATVTVTDSLGNLVSCSTSVTVTTVGGTARPGVSPPGPQQHLPPAQIDLQYLRVTPQQTTAGQPVTITTNVVNTGSEAGNYNVVLKINGRVEQTKMVSVGAQGTQPVKFTTAKAQPGTYTVDIGYQRASFIVTDTSREPSSAIAEGILFAAATAVIALLVALLIVVTRRRLQGY